MAQLKSLRAQVGVYGHVRANGIVEVDEPTAKKLLATKRFVRATEADIAAAQKKLADYIDADADQKADAAEPDQKADAKKPASKASAAK